MWYVCIDWADDHHDTAVVDESGRQVAKIRVPHMEVQRTVVDGLSASRVLS